MLPRLFGTSALLSRIEHCTELKQIVELMKRLRNKVNQLRQNAEQLGGASVDFRKHRVMSTLLGDLEIQFTAFNSVPGPASNAEMLLLVQGITNSISRIRAAYNPILAWPRNQQREIADVSLSAGIYGASFIAAAALPLATVGTLIAFFYGAPWLCGKARETTGLNNHRTACIRLLDEWQTVLQNLKLNLELCVPHEDRIVIVDSGVCPEEYICVISQDIMTNPYICMLDGITYEHDQILRWLTEHRNSPSNRVELEADQDPGSVLVLNRNLKDLIERYKGDHPVIKYADNEDDDHRLNDAAAAARVSF